MAFSLKLYRKPWLDQDSYIHFFFVQPYASLDANMVNVLDQTNASVTQDTLEKPATKVRKQITVKSSRETTEVFLS